MKKNIQYTLLVLLAMLMAGCTLSMEEYEITEENKGVEEPYTEVSPFGEVTYKYYDHVTPLNGEPQEYIIMINDSVIWFMDNLPSKWVPKAAHYIAANCSEKIPMGLCSKVLAVTRENGMIKVEYEPAEEDKVFEQLEMTLDLEYVVPNIGEDSASTRSVGRSGYWKNDTTFVDMSLYDRLRNGGTRADEGTKEETTSWQFQKYFDLPNDKQLYVDVKYVSTDYVIIHQYKNTETEYQEEWNDSYTERSYELLLGYGNDPEGASKSLKSFPAGVEELRGIKNALKAASLTDLKDQKVIKQITPEISIPAFPCGILFRFDVSTGYSLMGYGHITAKQRTETRRVGYIYNKGDKRKIDKEVNLPGKEPYFKFEDLYFGGSIDFWVRGRIGIGILVGKGAGVGGVVGAQLQGGLKATLETESLTDYTVVDRQNFKIGPYLTFSGFAEGLVKLGPFTFSIGDFMFNPIELIPDAMVNMKASVNSKKTSAKLNAITNDVGVNELSLVADLTFSKLETFFIFPKSTIPNQRAALRIYNGEINDGDTKYAELKGPDEQLEADKTYKFETLISDLDFEDTENTVFRIVPCIYDKGTVITTEYRNNVIVVNPGTPSISQPKCYQWYGRDLDEETWEYYQEELHISMLPVEYYADYGFSTVFEVKNATNIKKLGLIVEIRNPDGDKILTKDVDVPFEGICKSGKYSVTLDFIATCKPKSPDSGIDALYVNVRPYFVDQNGGRKEGALSKYINLYYPYEREGGPVTAENDVYVGSLM